jgi:hypothetical protein
MNRPLRTALGKILVTQAMIRLDLSLSNRISSNKCLWG